MLGALGVIWIALACPGCGASHHRGAVRPAASRPTGAPTAPAAGATRSPSASPGPRPSARRAPLIAVLPAAGRAGLFGWRPAVAVRGRTAVWVSRVHAYRDDGFTVTLMRFDQQLVTLTLHAGGSQPGGTGWRYGDMIGGRERRVVVAGFNGGFQEGYGAGGFQEGGRTGWPLLAGRASVVMYRHGGADIGAWRATVPAPRRPVAAVRQNLHLLIDGGRIASTVDRCIKVCWGDPLHEQPIVARSGLGVTPGGDLVWAAGHNLSVRALAEALAGAGVVRAMELDINPAWVAGYVYAHPRHRPLGVIPVVPGQTGIPGQLLAPYFRDFFSVDVSAG
jgi:hypothetical protein